jgi:hypothetical protein
MALLGGKFRIEEGADQFQRHRLADDSTAQHQHVHVVVLDSLVCRIMVVAEAGADTWNLVGRNRRADTAAAHEDATFGFAIAHGQTHRLRKVRIINRRRTVSAKVNYIAFLIQQICFDPLLQFETCVVCSNGNLHRVLLFSSVKPCGLRNVFLKTTGVHRLKM